MKEVSANNRHKSNGHVIDIAGLFPEETASVIFRQFLIAGDFILEIARIYQFAQGMNIVGGLILYILFGKCYRS